MGVQFSEAFCWCMVSFCMLCSGISGCDFVLAGGILLEDTLSAWRLRYMAFLLAQIVRYFLAPKNFHYT